MISVGIKSLGRKYTKYFCVEVLLPIGMFGGVRQGFVGISPLNNSYMKSEIAQKFTYM